MNKDNIKENIFNYELSQTPESILKYLPKEEVSTILRRLIDVRFEQINDDKRAESFMSVVNHPGSVRNDYKPQLIDLGSEKYMICIITFTTIENKKTIFINVLHSNFKMRSLTGGEIEKIYEQFEVFTPEFVCFFENDSDDLSDIQNLKVHKDAIQVAGHINSIKNLPKPGKYGDIEIEIVENMDFYKKYSNEYDDFFKENENNPRMVLKETYERLLELLDKRFIYLIKIKGEIAGLFVIDKWQTKYYESILIVEKFLYRKFRGIGLGLPMQRKAIDMIEAKDNEFIYGTIHPLNTASMKTALATGRYITGTYYFLKFNSN